MVEPGVQLDAKSAAVNEKLAALISKGAMEVIGGRIEKERARHGSTSETYYTIKNPFEDGGEEYEYYEELLNHGSIKDPRYIDLFERVVKSVKQSLRDLGVGSFMTLNCRFDARQEDNFLLYVFASFGPDV